MTKELSDLVIGFVNQGAENPYSFEATDYDEMKILHARSVSFFPSEFNSLMNKFIYSSERIRNAENCHRLLKILDVIASLPPELREPPHKNDAKSATLIPMFVLERADKVQIFELCTGMRKIVFSSPEFDEPHRLRLLNRIAAIEAETQKPKGMFDVVRGGMNDLGETLGKFGKDIKPLTDRMREVVGIARKATKEYDQLPAPEDIKRLPAPSAEESADS